jgi:hypothetical protein
MLVRTLYATFPAEEINSGARLAILELSKLFLKIYTTFSFNFKSFFLHANPREMGQID